MESATFEAWPNHYSATLSPTSKGDYPVNQIRDTTVCSGLKRPLAQRRRHSWQRPNPPCAGVGS
jgi:hypothetical protein